ncbi:Transcriptional regulator/sugar kinase [uncultured Pleomorphomonas sp.]|uniref:Transcriptional regulator/sugar kinase n=1 Tax=uncultured Pleomorphomonas sp. TaxID=442121 RepID=A0A212L8W0_9HYPH|nr:ROK family transcriptional regulator [uncultured Pleomorphomonas sp.]SCM73927.1 Transcriptional regulator/sugar kinase [uncultured Pleomorphomonas sp.]
MRGNSSTSRALNRRLILNLLRRHGPVSRAEIATITGLSPAAVTFVVAELVEESLIVEREAVTGATGRRPVPIDINYEAHLAFGFKLNADGIDCVLTDLATNPLATWHAPISDTSPDGMIKAIADAMPQMLADSGRSQTEVMGIGVSIPGEVDVRNGICRRSPRFGWTDLPFGQLLGERVHVPTWIDDDISAFAVAQKLFGAGRDRRNFVALAVGTGIGTSLIINAEIYRGARNVAGRFGHITSVPGGRLCECGRRGCLMAHAAEPFMLETWRTRRRAASASASASRSDFVAAVEAGEADALSVLEESGLRIGRHLADLVNLFDPEVIVVGGEAVQFGEALIGPIRLAMEANVFFSKPELLPDWVPGSWARGAAALATQGIFDFERSPSG